MVMVSSPVVVHRPVSALPFRIRLTLVAAAACHGAARPPASKAAPATNTLQRIGIPLPPNRAGFRHGSCRWRHSCGLDADGNQPAPTPDRYFPNKWPADREISV